MAKTSKELKRTGVRNNKTLGKSTRKTRSEDWLLKREEGAESAGPRKVLLGAKTNTARNRHSVSAESQA